MQKILGFLLILLTMQANAQSILGDWTGELEIPGQSLPLILHISQADTELTVTMDSPRQAAFGLKSGSSSFTGDSLQVAFPSLGAKINGRLRGDTLHTQFQQAGMTFPITFTRLEADADQSRPQDPQPPYPYAVRDITFENEAAGIRLVGTLTYPEDRENPPAVVLISGSGAQNRDSEIFNHRPFAVWADQLSRAGIAVLRYDEREVGDSEGTFATATSEDFAGDVKAAVRFLRKESGLGPVTVGLIGHSEGGLVAPMVANDLGDIGFVVLLAGPGVPGKELMLMQNQRLMESQGISGGMLKTLVKQKEKLFDLVSGQSEASKQELEKAILKYYEDLNGGAELSENEQIKRAVQQLSSPWMRYFLTYDPAPALRQLNCPVLTLNGDKDLQVDAEQNLPAIEAALEAGGNQQFTLRRFPDLNHLLQKAETGMIDEYGTIEQTVNPAVLNLVTDWIQEVTAKK